MGPAKAFVFDAYGTLFDVRSVLARCEEVFPLCGAALTTLWRSKQLEYTWLRSLMGRYEDFWQLTRAGLLYACQSLGLTSTPERIEYLMQAYLVLSPFPDVAAALESLAGVPCAILSNGSPQMLQSVVKNARFEGRFQHILSVDEVRIYKPSPLVYQLAETHLGIPRGQIAFVSSNCWDIAGAGAFGLQTYWLNRQSAPVEMLGVRPDCIINTATELAAVAGAKNAITGAREAENSD
jgi:2-haloacid dehalogenase